MENKIELIQDKLKIQNEVMLSDVLAFLKTQRDNVLKSKSSNTVKLFNCKELSLAKNYILDSWDLSTPFLKDQKQEIHDKIFQ